MMLSAFGVTLLLLLSSGGKVDGLVGVPTHISLHPFASGFDEHFGEGACGENFKEPILSPITVTQKTAIELSHLSLQDDGFKVLLGAWNTGARRRFNPKHKAWWFEKSNKGKMLMRCKRDVWTRLRSTLIDRGPSCWRKIGYYGHCESLPEDACREERGCQWNPIIDVKLIDNVKPEVFATKAKRRNLSVYKDKVKRILTNADVVRVHGIFAHTYAQMVAKNMLELEVEHHAGMYRRSSLTATSQLAFHSRLVNQISDMKRNEMQSLLASSKGRPVGAKRSCPSNGAFHAVHNDLVVDGIRNLYDAAMSKAGNRDTKSDLYYLEMANFWAPLDAHTMQVNFLGFRVRRNVDDPGPMEPGGYHLCPGEGEDAIPIVFAPLVEGQGYLFLTRYTQHTALPIHDIFLREKSRNCRTSVEFRFFFLGERPLETYEPPQESEGQHAHTHAFRAAHHRRHLQQPHPPTTRKQDGSGGGVGSHDDEAVLLDLTRTTESIESKSDPPATATSIGAIGNDPSALPSDREDRLKRDILDAAKKISDIQARAIAHGDMGFPHDEICEAPAGSGDVYP